MRMKIVNKKTDNKIFNTARRKHSRNINVSNSRGGIRM